MKLIPAIDLREGRCVRLYQGAYAGGRQAHLRPGPVGLDGLVIYKVWSGTPKIEEYRDINNPLGPLQGIGSDAVKPTL